jgi:hypothetical protein
MKLCNECEEPISEKRLAAVPDAEYCVRCQRMYDKRIKPGDSRVDGALVAMGELDQDMFAPEAHD